MTYFPILIKYTDTNTESLIADPRYIQSGRQFVVLKTRVGK